MREITLEELLEAGCHFGHQVTRQNPKARDFIYEARDGIHIIDLALTKKGLDEAAAYIKSLAKRNGTLLVIGSKRQAQPIILSEVKQAKDTLSEKNITDNLFTVTSRWIGGTLTNSEEVKKNYKRLEDLTSLLKDDFAKAKYTKKELGLMEKERQKLEAFYGGIANLKVRPDAIFVVDTHQEELAVREANRTGVTIVGIVDTNADPDPINYVIPANDDAVGSLELLIKHIISAWTEGRVDSTKESAVAEAMADKGEVKEEKTEEKAERPAPKKKAAAKKAKATK